MARRYDIPFSPAVAAGAPRQVVTGGVRWPRSAHHSALRPRPRAVSGDRLETSLSGLRARPRSGVASTRAARIVSVPGQPVLGRLFAPNSVWNQPLAANAPLDPALKQARRPLRERGRG